jgi:hypothetical protein
MSVFEVFYWLGLVAEGVIRAPIRKKQKKEAKSERRAGKQETILLSLLFLAMFFLPLIYSATNWLDFADYSLPIWAGWLGAHTRTLD